MARERGAEAEKVSQVQDGKGYKVKELRHRGVPEGQRDNPVLRVVVDLRALVSLKPRYTAVPGWW